MPQVDVITQIVIDRPQDVVAKYASNPDNAPEWYVNIKSVNWKTPPPPPAAVGSRITFVADFLGKRLEYTYEIVEKVDGERFVMRMSEGPFPMETTYTWESVSGSSTRMKLRNRGQPTGFSILMAPFMAFMMRRANRKDLAKLKQILESDTPSEPS